MTPEFSSEQRELLQNEAGDLFQQIVLKGAIATTDDRIVPGGSDHRAFALLLDLGLVALEPGAEGYVPVDPSVVQARVVAPMGQRAAEMLAESTGWATTFAELAQSFRRTPPSDLPLVEVRGLSNINRFLAAAVADAEFELLTAHPDGARPAAVLSVALERDQQALRRGVKLRTLYQHPARRSTATREYVEVVTDLGGEVRTLDEFFNRLIVIDRRIALIPGTESGTESGAESDDVAIAIYDANLVSYLVDVFERSWERARTFTDREPLTEREIAGDAQNMTARLLIEGHSDQVSAKRIGVSARTYAGYVAALKAAYNVETRFQLGYAIGQQDLRQKDLATPPPQI